MGSNQKFILVLGMLAVAATCLAAPYKWSGRPATMPSLNGGVTGDTPAQGTRYSPLWSPPAADDIGRATLEASPSAPLLVGVVVDLDAGKLGLWWALIAIATTVAILLTGRGSTDSAPANK